MGRSSGSGTAIDRANRMACPAHGICSDWPSQRASPSVIASGVRLSETSVAMRRPARRPSGDCGPASATMPVSMPPEPVTGLCILPRWLMVPSTAARIASGAPPVDSRIWRNDAASRLSRSTPTRTSSGWIRGSASSRHAAWGRTAPPPPESPGPGSPGPGSRPADAVQSERRTGHQFARTRSSFLKLPPPFLVSLLSLTVCSKLGCCEDGVQVPGAPDSGAVQRAEPHVRLCPRGAGPWPRGSPGITASRCRRTSPRPSPT